MVMLVAQVMVYIPNSEARIRIIRLLLKMWKDPDSDIRIISIRMIQVYNIQIISHFYHSSWVKKV